MLSLGRTPIREALFRLHAENLVDYHNHSGIYVKDISFKSVKDFFEAYVPIEMAVAQIAPLRIDENSLNELSSKPFIKAMLNPNIIQKLKARSVF